MTFRQTPGTKGDLSITDEMNAELKWKKEEKIQNWFVTFICYKFQFAGTTIIKVAFEARKIKFIQKIVNCEGFNLLKLFENK